MPAVISTLRHPYDWNHQSLADILARMLDPELEDWMYDELVLKEMLALSRGVLALGVTRQPGTSAFDKLPNEVVDMILLLACGRDRKTRMSTQLSCRRFRHILLLNHRQYSDLASLPPLPSAFMMHYLRNVWLDRTCQIILDEENESDLQLPPTPLLLNGVCRADTIIVQHTLTLSEIVGALKREETLPRLEVLRISADDSESCHEHVPTTDIHPRRTSSLNTPRLRVLQLFHTWIDFPFSAQLRELSIDAASQFVHRATCNAAPTDALYSLLSRNTSLVTLELVDAVESGDWRLEVSRPRIPLTSLTSVIINMTLTEPAIWLLDRLQIPSTAYLYVDVGRDTGKRPDVEGILNALIPHLVGRTFNTLVIVEAWGCTRILLSEGLRVWEPSSTFDEREFSVPVLLQGEYLSADAAVDLTIHWERPFRPKVRWPHILAQLHERGLDTSSIKCLEIKTDFNNCDLHKTPVASLFGGVEVLRFWPDRYVPLRNMVWRLCAPRLGAWSVVTSRLRSLFPRLHSIVDVNGCDIVYGHTAQELVLSLTKYSYAHAD
ncbi:hypothetical protein PENSPDRAFT_672503 [Peniophora sp. CONT]|nr:hypothetical protein PENSPDRAFT_672503 [Peniophora sp. CONT]